MVRTVELSKGALKELKAVPKHVATKLLVWIASVEARGLEETSKQPGYHDEPLKGSRAGQRSIRLSIHYRAIYVIKKDAVEFVLVEEVNKHKY